MFTVIFLLDRKYEKGNAADCQRLIVKCTYPKRVLLSMGDALPRLVNLGPSELPCISSPNSDELVAVQVLGLLDTISRKSWSIDVFVSAYFVNFHRNLPILNQGIFENRLKQADRHSHLLMLLLSMVLISHLYSKIAAEAEEKTKEELYTATKSMYSLLLRTGKVSSELVQAGVIIAAYEHCQALHQEAWLGIGICARLGQLLGLHHLIRMPMPKEMDKRIDFETKKCLWWGIVVLERYVILHQPNPGDGFGSEDLGEN